MAAVLRRAAYDIALYRGSNKLRMKKIGEGAYRWMFDDATDHFTSFRSICTLLDQDPHEIRRKTLTLTRQDVRKFDLVDAHGWL